MNDCRNCANMDNEYCFACDNGNQFKPMTNAERIRAMSDEELAELFYSGDFPWCVYEEDVVPCTYEDIPVHPCERCLLAWLKEEAEE